MNYLVVIEKAQSNYAAYIPELPGCIAAAATLNNSELVAGETFGPQLQTAGVVHGEYVHGGATDGRNPHDTHTTE